MLVPQLLLEALEELGEHDFGKFKWFLALNVLNGRKQMDKFFLESAHRHDTASKMIESYGEEMAVDVTVQILRRMKHNNAAEQLKKTYTEGKVSCPLKTSSFALGLPTPQEVFAEGASGAVAPMVIIATNHSVININGNMMIPTAPTINHHNFYYKN